MFIKQKSRWRRALPPISPLRNKMRRAKKDEKWRMP